MGTVLTETKKHLKGKRMDLVDLKRKLIQTGELIDPTQMDTYSEKTVAYTLIKNGIKTVPQFQLDKYTFDFKLVGYPVLIEVDGNVHAKLEVRHKDYRKDRVAQKRGFKVLRYSNEELKESTNNLIQEVRAVMKKTGRSPYELVIYQQSWWESVKLWWMKRKQKTNPQ
jgi:very-short-patch-repair endonuclease